MPLPELFVSRCRQLIPPDRVAQVIDSYLSEPRLTLRVNNLKSSPEKLMMELAAEGFTLTALPLADSFQASPASKRELTQSAAWREGRFYIQNPSSLLPVLALNPRPGERVLDLCAAPGGKSSHLAALMGNRGELVCVEKSIPRSHRLRSVLKQMGVEARVLQKDGTGLWRHQGESFDKILLDAPCSGEGQLDPEDVGDWGMKKIKRLTRIQSRLLYSAYHCLKPGGILVYATCTMAPEENEGVLTRFIRAFPGALAVEAITISQEIPALSGLTSFGRKDFDSSLSGLCRIIPDGLWQAFTFCRLKKKAGALGTGLNNQ